MNRKKIYVITGAASGIGLALTESLCRNNTVFAGYRTESKREMLESLSENIYPFYADYSKPETINPAIEFIKSKTDKVDTLVNIAGCVVAGPIENIRIDEIKRQFDVNVFGHLEMTQKLASLLNDGKVINISSMASYEFFRLFNLIVIQNDF